MKLIEFAATPPSPPSSTPSGNGGHECPTCKKTFSRSDILRKHLRTHVPCPCPVCGQLFQDKFTLAKHQIEVRKTRIIDLRRINEQIKLHSPGLP